MARRGPVDAWLLLGGYHLTGDLTGFTDKREAVTEEVTVLNSSYQEHGSAGVVGHDLEINGYYDDAGLRTHEALKSNEGSTRVAAYGVAGTATGAAFTGWSGAIEADYERIVSRNELHKIRASFRNAGVVEFGTVIRPLAGATATGFGVANAIAASGQSIDFGASNVSGGAGYLLITSLDATASGFQCDLMHSADNITFTSWGGFAAVTATAVNSSWAQRINSTVNIQRYVAERHRDAGGSSFASGTFFVGFVPR